MYVCNYVCMYVRTYVRMYMYMDMYVCMYMYTYMYMYMYMYMCIYTYVCVYIYIVMYCLTLFVYQMCSMCLKQGKNKKTSRNSAWRHKRHPRESPPRRSPAASTGGKMTQPKRFTKNI
jgi:type IV secretory pathway VirB3-like protein